MVGHELAYITIKGAEEHNLKNISVQIERGAITLITGVSGSGKSSLAFDTVLAECQRRFFYTLSHYSRQFLDIAARPKVSSMTGLSPAIALSQNETMPSRRATVGGLSDASELFGVLFARFGVRHCPKHGLATQGGDAKSMAERLGQTMHGETIALATPVAKSKKGNFATLLKRFADKGFRQALIDGQLVSLDKIPELAKEEKHTIAVVIDIVKIKDGGEARLLRSLEAVLREGEGFAEYYPVDRSMAIDAKAGVPLALGGGCPSCGFTWPRLDSRHFSRNSLGKCPSCDGYGVKGRTEEEEDADEALTVLDMADRACELCRGTGYNPELGAVTIAGRSLLEYDAMPLAQLAQDLQALRKTTLAGNPAVKRLLDEIVAQVDRLLDVGLSYLTLSRRIRTLSGGEAQRVRLAGILSENLRGILYVLDEPSQGLHQKELEKIWEVLVRLKEQGNTLLLVDHDEFFMRKADWIIDLGPGGGRDGGELMAKFRPDEAAQFAALSVTARFLAERRAVPSLLGTVLKQKNPLSPPAAALVVKEPRLHNLRMAAASFAQGALNVVTGVSGAGKSTLVMAVLFENLVQAMAGKGRKSWRYCAGIEGTEAFTACHLIDRRPIAKSSVSMPATYLDIFGELRDLYASLPDSQIAGLTARSFSLFHQGGRCENCKGRGVVNLSMRFLADAKEVCTVCQGTRFEASVNDITFQGLSLSEVLNLSLAEAFEHLQHHRKIARRLRPALDMGLGYLKLGQPSSTLSGGEAQRLKLIPLLTKNVGAGTLVILDEPTTGLHFQDVDRLKVELRKMVANGATVIVLEQHDDIVRAADWLLALGPGAAQEGGQLVYQGPPPVARSH